MGGGKYPKFTLAAYDHKVMVLSRCLALLFILFQVFIMHMFILYAQLCVVRAYGSWKVYPFFVFIFSVFLLPLFFTFAFSGCVM